MFGFEFMFTDVDRVFYYDKVVEEGREFAQGICWANDGSVYNFVQLL